MWIFSILLQLKDLYSWMWFRFSLISYINWARISSLLAWAVFFKFENYCTIFLTYHRRFGERCFLLWMYLNYDVLYYLRHTVQCSLKYTMYFDDWSTLYKNDWSTCIKTVPASQQQKIHWNKIVPAVNFWQNVRVLASGTFSNRVR